MQRRPSRSEAGHYETAHVPIGRQFREGRQLAGISQADLAAAANVIIDLVARGEAVDGLPMITRRDSTALQTALDAAGVDFIPDNDGGTGVRLRRLDPSCAWLFAFSR